MQIRLTNGILCFTNDLFPHQRALVKAYFFLRKMHCFRNSSLYVHPIVNFCFGPSGTVSSAIDTVSSFPTIDRM